MLASSMRIADLLADARLPRLEQRMLIEAASGVSRSSMASAPEQALDAGAALRLEALVQRRLGGEPMAHLVGVREFYGRSFSVDSRVLIPRPETELLVDLALAAIRAGARSDAPWRVLDIGTGSGCIAVCVALECAGLCLLQAIDVSNDALEVARGNATALGAAVTFAAADVRVAEPLFGLGAPFQLILGNLPYIRKDDPHLAAGDLRFEPVQALTDGNDGLGLIQAAIDRARTALVPAGLLMLEHGYDQAQAVRQRLAGAGFEAIQSHPDLSGIERVSIGRRSLQPC